MAVSVKSEREIELMRESCRILGEVHDRLKEVVRPGISTLEIDIEAEKLIRSYDCIPNFLHYNGFPGSVCVSVNEEVVHGIPKKSRKLKEGDIVSLDCGLIYKGYHSDAARTYPVGEVDPELLKLIKETENCFFEGIKFAKEGNHLHDISNAIADYAEKCGYGIVTALVGHGIGTSLHEDPSIPNYHMNNRGIKLVAGMTLAIEPMINLGRGDVDFMDDGWTCVTSDRLPSSHYENTILITKGEPEILTLPNR